MADKPKPDPDFIPAEGGGEPDFIPQEQQQQSTQQTASSSPGFLEPSPGEGAIMRGLKGYGRATLGSLEGSARDVIGSMIPSQEDRTNPMLGDTGLMGFGARLAKKTMYDPSQNAAQHVSDVASETESRTGKRPTGYETAGRALARIPVLGPAALEMGERGAKGDVAGALWEAAGFASMPRLMEYGTRIGSFAGSPELPEIGKGQIPRTIGKTIANFDIRKPLRTFGDIPRYWQESSPGARMLAETKRAIQEGRAAKIPTRLPSGLRDWSDLPSSGRTNSIIPESSDAIRGTLPRGFGRIILTPEEAAQREQLYRMAQKSAHERGMQFAGGQVPAEGRQVPVRPRENITEEWRGRK